MGEEEFAALKADIKQHGLRTTIEIYRGLILDGRHRWRACRELKIDPETMTLDDHDIGGDPFAYVVSANLHRRHLTTGQRAMIGVNVKRAMEAEADARMKAGTAPEPCGQLATGSGRSREKAGEMVNVGGRSIQRAETVTDHAAPEVAAAVNAGTVKVSDAAAVAKLSKKQQRAALKAVESGAAKTLKEAAAKGGKQVADPRLWDRWDDAFGKLKRLTDDLGREFPSAAFAKTTAQLNAAYETRVAWRKGMR